MLTLDGVSKVYKVGTFGGKSLVAVNDVSFDVGDSEVVSLIGESGSGKTTIGKMILHLTSISSGAIRFNGVDVSRLNGGARNKKALQLPTAQLVGKFVQDLVGI